MVSAYLLGMRREFMRAEERGVEIDIDETEPVIAATQEGERQAAADVEAFGEYGVDEFADFPPGPCEDCGGYQDYQEFEIDIVQGGAPIGAGPEADAGPIVEPVDAVRFLRDKVPLKSKTVERLVRSARKRGVLTSATFTSDLRGLIDEEVRVIVEEGVPVGDAVDRISGVIEGAGLDPVSPGRLQTILRTNVQTAYNAGRLEMLNTPAMKKAFPFLIYRTMEDGRVRPTHRKMNNKAYRVGHPIWRVWTPPNGYN
jgi:SPP1 gp7 family putative phage head morphogenesis protein